MNNSILSGFLSQLNLSVEESAIVTFLAGKSPQTILTTARMTGINRTRVYRIIEDLAVKGIVEEVVEEHKKLVKIVGLHQIELLIEEEEKKARVLRQMFPQISPLFSSVTEALQPGTRVIFHRGPDGIKQMVWNTLSAKKEVVGYTYRSINEVVGEAFAKEWHTEFIERNLIFRDLYSDHYLESIKKTPHDHSVREEKHFQGRYVKSKILNINHQTDIYNNVVAYYNWFEGEVFGIEVYNKKIADMQKQLFEIVWAQTKKTA